MYISLTVMSFLTKRSATQSKALGGKVAKFCDHEHASTIRLIFVYRHTDNTAQLLYCVNGVSRKLEFPIRSTIT